MKIALSSYDGFKTSPLSTSSLFQVAYNNYEKEPYKGYSYAQFPQANLVVTVFTCPQAKLTSQVTISTSTNTF